MTKEYWVRERGTNCWCPFEPPNTVLLGMNLITDKPPGVDAGWFWFNDDNVMEIVLQGEALKAATEGD